MINTVVIGSAGRVGKVILQEILIDNELALVGAIEAKNHPLIGKDISSVISGENFNIHFTDSIYSLNSKIDVIIDFSSPDSIDEYIPFAINNNIPVVLGTTGIAHKLDYLREVSNSIPILISPNMSLGMNILFEFLKYAMKYFDRNVDIEIIETHHKYKKDAPSGSARVIYKIISKAFDPSLTDNDIEKIMMKNLNKPRSVGEIGIHSLRYGESTASHKIIFSLGEEELQFYHNVSNRSVFAKGALKAAKFIVHQKPGTYSMFDVLKSNLK